MRIARLSLIFLLIFLSACQAATPIPSAEEPPTLIPQLQEKTSIVESVPSLTPAPESTNLPEASPTVPPEKTSMPTAPQTNQNPSDALTLLGGGINLGNALEAPSEGEWGVTLQSEYFQLIKEQGFQSVRVPIRWSAHAETAAPYTIDPVFFDRIEWVVDQALRNDLAVIVNIHHYGELFEDPAGQRERFLAIWEQIAARFQNAPQAVVFELMNEPNGKAMTAAVWNELLADALAVVRETNPQRYVVIGPVNWNSVDSLDTLVLPEDDRYLIGTFHYYLPFEFTHQGAEWTPGADQWLGTKWEATAAQKAAIARDLDKAQRWSEKNGRPVLLGEFGAYSKADMDSRALWTAYIAREAEARGLSWAYWEFCAGFGIYDPNQKVFFDPLVEALFPSP